MGSIIRIQPRQKHIGHVGIIIQARQTSKRFPGKSMTNLLGKPVLQHVIERAKLIRTAKKYKITVVVAVPDADESEPMLELATRLKVENFCGSEDNVLERYYQAARFFNFTHIVRITGDCPFIDPRVSSEVVQLLLWRKLDYVSNVFPRRTYPKGCDTEAFSLDALEVAYLYWKEEFANLSNLTIDQINNLEYLAEHVTPFMQQHPEIKRANVEQQLNQSQKNWCVDHPEDIERLTKMVRRTPELKIVK